MKLIKITTIAFFYFFISLAFASNTSQSSASNNTLFYFYITALYSLIVSFYLMKFLIKERQNANNNCLRLPFGWPIYWREPIEHQRFDESKAVANSSKQEQQQEEMKTIVTTPHEVGE